MKKVHRLDTPNFPSVLLKLFILLFIFFAGQILLDRDIYVFASDSDSRSSAIFQTSDTAPVILKLDPKSVRAGSAEFTMQVYGTDFVSSTVILWNGGQIPTTFSSTNLLSGKIPASAVTKPGWMPVAVQSPPENGGVSNTLYFEILPRHQVYSPVLIRDWPPYPRTPVLAYIDTSDGDNFYSVNWSKSRPIDSYILEESIDPTFRNPQVVYSGVYQTWTVPGAGKYPGMYYYRVKAINPYGVSAYSNVVNIRIFPLFVGLKVRWDGQGFYRGSENYDVGWHQTVEFQSLSEIDTVQAYWHDWYNPDPLDFGAASWHSFYSISTGNWKASSVVGDPSWKWGYSFKLKYDSRFEDGETISIDGQPFIVRGPRAGYTSWGSAIGYWELSNNAKILVFDDGGDWTLYINPGDAVLRYDIGPSHLLVYDNVKRYYYYRGSPTIETDHYITQLTSATSIPGSPAFNPLSPEEKILNNPDSKTPSGIDRLFHHGPEE